MATDMVTKYHIVAGNFNPSVRIFCDRITLVRGQQGGDPTRLPNKDTQSPRGEGKRGSQDEGEKGGNEGSPRADFPPEDGDGCETGNIEDHENREDHYLQFRHNGKDVGCSQGLDEHDHGEFLPKDAENESRSYGLGKPQEVGNGPQHSVNQAVHTPKLHQAQDNASHDEHRPRDNDILPDPIPGFRQSGPDGREMVDGDFHDHAGGNLGKDHG